mmetsp:Transcript_22855/g.37614  ORF Transcript_22855/g.37614 Transcript_22855/m.37614 type:complete len:262 (-) Transcript_22855:1-786(-)
MSSRRKTRTIEVESSPHSSTDEGSRRLHDSWNCQLGSQLTGRKERNLEDNNYAMQWYRLTGHDHDNRQRLEEIPGATSSTYTPTADDVGTVLRFKCTPVNGTIAKDGSPEYQDTPEPVNLDPDTLHRLETFLRDGIAEFKIFMRGRFTKSRVLQVSRSGIHVTYKTATMEESAEFKASYNSGVKVTLDPEDGLLFVLHTDSNHSFECVAETPLQRDLIVITIRHFCSDARGFNRLRAQWRRWRWWRRTPMSLSNMLAPVRA